MSEEPIADATADCVLPADIMLCILTRLPVKSLLRFGSVCKPWRQLLATPRFIKMHHDQFSDDPKNQNFIVYSLSDVDNEIISLFSSVESNANEPTNLDLPDHGSFLAMYSVGCLNGLVCIGFLFTPFEMGIALWNPALRLSKSVRFPVVHEKISLGFGYDAEGDDFRVVKIVCPKAKNAGVVVEVYSAKSDAWETIELDFQFRVSRLRNDAIVNGNPYWVAEVDENVSRWSEVLVWFDVTNSKFKMVPLSNLRVEEGAEVPFVDWEGCLAALVSIKKEGRVECVDVWVYDDGGKMWRKNLSFGPVELNVYRILQCSKNGKIAGDCLDGTLFVFDPKSRWSKEIEISEGRRESFKIYGYSEGLAYIQGMEVVVNEEEEDEEEEEEEEEEDDV